MHDLWFKHPVVDLTRSHSSGSHASLTLVRSHASLTITLPSFAFSRFLLFWSGPLSLWFRFLGLNLVTNSFVRSFVPDRASGLKMFGTNEEIPNVNYAGISVTVSSKQENVKRRSWTVFPWFVFFFFAVKNVHKMVRQFAFYCLFFFPAQLWASRSTIKTRSDSRLPKSRVGGQGQW